MEYYSSVKNEPSIKTKLLVTHYEKHILLSNSAFILGCQ